MADPARADERTLVALDDGIWCAHQPLRFFGMQIGTRMTVVRLPAGGLLLHSPIEPTEPLRAQLAGLGPVRHVVAPNRFHHLYAGRWDDAGPEVHLHVAPGLLDKRTDLAGAHVLGDEPHPDWAAVLDQCPVAGMPLANEVLFLHRPSRTLVTCDLAFRIGPSEPPWTRFWFRVLGAYGHLDTTVLERLVTRDRAAARASLERALAWDFDRVVVSHGDVQETGGREAFRRAWSWLLAG
jgi:hypothetical protein